MALPRTTAPNSASAPAGSRAEPRAAKPNPVCPVCGSEDTFRSFEARDPHYGNPGTWCERECRECRSLFLDPMPTPEQIDGFYPEEEYYAYRPAARAPACRGRCADCSASQSGTREPTFGRPGRVLDFGCGAGDFLVRHAGAGLELPRGRGEARAMGGG